MMERSSLRRLGCVITADTLAEPQARGTVVIVVRRQEGRTVTRRDDDDEEEAPRVTVDQVANVAFAYARAIQTGDDEGIVRIAGYDEMFAYYDIAFGRDVAAIVDLLVALLAAANSEEDLGVIVTGFMYEVAWQADVLRPVIARVIKIGLKPTFEWDPDWLAELRRQGDLS